MQKISKFILIFFIAVPLVFAFGPNTIKKIDEIKNNTGTDIVLNPTDKVKINYFTGQKALQSTVDGELEESAVTNTELGYVSGVTSGIQGQLDSKTPLTRLINTTAPLQGGGDLTTDRTLSILQSGTAQDGYLSQTDWNTFNSKQDALTFGDLTESTSSILTITGGTGAVIGSGTSINVQQSSTTTDGYLSSVDWNTFNNKQSTLTGVDGDLYYYNSGLSNLTIGTTGQVLQVSALGFPEWANLPPSVSVTTKGDLQTYSTAPDRLPVGTNGQVLSANSATSTGLEWIDPDFYTSPLTTQGDLLYRNATQDTRLAIGTEGQLLTVTSGEPSWQDAPIALPDQTGHNTEYLRTNGISADWSNINDSVNGVNDNILKCASFEDCDADGVVTTGAGIDLSGGTPRTVEASGFNNSKYNLAQSAAGILDYTFTDSSNFDGKQMVAYCEIKTANTQVTFSAGADGVEAGSLDVSSDNTWKYYKIPFVGGATTQYFKVNHANAGEIPNIDIDNCFIGKSSNETREISQAHFVGNLAFSDAGCAFTRNSTTIGSLVDSDCIGTATGAVQAITGGKAGVNIPNYRIDGVYRMVYKGLLYNANNINLCLFNVSKSETTFDLKNGRTYAQSSTNGSREQNSIEGYVRFQSGDDGNIFILNNNAGGSTNCNVYGSTGDFGAFDVYFYPDDTSTVVTQENTSDPEKAGFVYFSMSEMIENDTWQRADGECLLKTKYPDYVRNVSSAVDCTITTANDGFLLPDLETDNRFIRAADGTTLAAGTTQNDATAVNGLATTTTGSAHSHLYYGGNYSGFTQAFNARGATSNNISWSTDTSGTHTHGLTGDAETRPNSIAMYAYVRVKDNKNLIVGKFENINSSDSSNSIMANGANQTVSPTINIPWIELTDRNNEWDGDEFTASKAGTYFFFGRASLTGGVGAIGVYKDTGSGYNLDHYVGEANFYFNGAIELNAGDKIAFRPNVTLGMSANSTTHRLSILSHADYEAIVKNLSDQAVKCQTKTLSGNASTTGVMSDLTFNNLTVGKKYRITGKFDMTRSVASATNKNIEIQILNGTESLFKSLNRNYGGTEWITNGYPNRYFTATDTVVTSTITALADMLVAGATDRTYLQLCELPSAYVETTQF